MIPRQQDSQHAGTFRENQPRRQVAEREFAARFLLVDQAAEPDDRVDAQRMSHWTNSERRPPLQDRQSSKASPFAVFRRAQEKQREARHFAQTVFSLRRVLPQVASQ